MLQRSLIFAPLAIVLTVSTTNAEMITMATQAHPLPSTITIDLYIGGGPRTGGTFIATTGPAEVTGQCVVDLNLDASGSGTATLVSANVLLAAFGPSTIDLGTIGTVDLVADNVEIAANGDGMVDNGAISSIVGTYLNYAFVSGTAALINPTGPIASFLSNLDVSYDFTSFPVEVNDYQFFSIPLGTVDNGTGLYSPLPEFNFSTEASLALETGSTPIYANVIADLHFVAVPEAGSLTMLGMLVMSAGAAVARRKLLPRWRDG